MHIAHTDAHTPAMSDMNVPICLISFSTLPSLPVLSSVVMARVAMERFCDLWQVECERVIRLLRSAWYPFKAVFKFDARAAMERFCDLRRVKCEGAIKLLRSACNPLKGVF